jgi:hypothetical protein
LHKEIATEKSNIQTARECQHQLSLDITKLEAEAGQLQKANSSLKTSHKEKTQVVFIMIALGALYS